jgi:hypothetical protein
VDPDGEAVPTDVRTVVTTVRPTNRRLREPDDLGIGERRPGPIERVMREVPRVGATADAFDVLAQLSQVRADAARSSCGRGTSWACSRGRTTRTP